MTLFLQSDAAVHCNVEEETMRKQVSRRISFLVRAVGLGRGTKADTVAAPVSASPVGIVMQPQCLCLGVPAALPSSVIGI